MSETPPGGPPTHGQAPDHDPHTGPPPVTGEGEGQGEHRSAHAAEPEPPATVDHDPTVPIELGAPPPAGTGPTVPLAKSTPPAPPAPPEPEPFVPVGIDSPGPAPPPYAPPTQAGAPPVPEYPPAYPQPPAYEPPPFAPPYAPAPDTSTPGAGTPLAFPPSPGAPADPGSPDVPPYPPYAPPRMDGVATASLVVSALGVPLVFCFCLGVPMCITGIIMGFVARKRVFEANGRLTGDGVGLASIIVGSVGLALFVLATVAVFIDPGSSRL